jgi:hypothetical protein
VIIVSKVFSNPGALKKCTDDVMKKSIQRWLLYCLIQSAFSAFSIAGPVPDKDLANDSHLSQITRPDAIRPSFGQNAGQAQSARVYTKLDRSGLPLPESAAAWVMVKDNFTGLIWEVKRNLDGVSHYDDPNDADNTYSWYDSNPDTNGGDPGTPGNGMNTEAFINAMNRAHFGGYSDWRLPTIRELAYLADTRSTNPSINSGYFPNTVSSWYWSSSTSANYPYHAWGVGFRHGYDSYNYKYLYGYVRAVRGGQHVTETALNKMGSGFDSHIPPGKLPCEQDGERNATDER